MPCVDIRLECSWSPWKPIQWNSLRAVFELTRRPREVWRTVAINSPESQRPLSTVILSICRPAHFTWPTASCLNCCRSQSLPLYSNSTNCEIFSSEEISLLDSLHRHGDSVTIQSTSVNSDWQTCAGICVSQRRTCGLLCVCSDPHTNMEQSELMSNYFTNVYMQTWTNTDYLGTV